MGSLLSCCCSQGVKIVKSLIEILGENFTPEEWNQVHNTGSVDEEAEQLSALGTNLLSTSDSALPIKMKKAVYICCNTYTRPDYSLGVGPMNDSITVATYLAKIGFKIYFVHNPKSTEFIKYLKHMLDNTQDQLLVYYTGHGASVDDKNGDEEDGKDEALVFDDNFVIDDTLADVLASSSKPDNCKCILLNDCCHSGSIWDLQSKSFQGRTLPKNTMSLSAARDSQTAKQTSMDGNDQGIFTFYFFKLLSKTPNMTPTQMETSINSYISKYEQVFTKCSTTESLYTQPIFT